MGITIRTLAPARDFAGVAALMSAVESEETTAEMLAEREQRLPENEIRYRVVAVDEAGAVVGFGQALRQPWMKAGRFGIWTVVAPRQSRQGLGQQLLTHLERFAREQGAIELGSEVREGHPDWLRFAQQHGYQHEKHTFESVLDLTNFDEAPFAEVIPAVEAAGIRFLSLGAAGNTTDNQRKLYELNRETAADNPGNDGDFAPFEDFSKFVFQAPWFRADGQILAADGEDWVGLAAVGYAQASNAAYNAFTGVARDYRGRQIALALKLLAIRYAQSLGAGSIRTNNDSQNGPMLAINHKLGYRPEPGIYYLVKVL